MEGCSFYHVMNRITMKQRLIEEYGVKEMLLDSIRRAAEFSGSNLRSRVYCTLFLSIALCSMLYALNSQFLSP